MSILTMNLINVWKYVKDNVSSVPPKNMSKDEYLNLMNQKVYNLVIKFYNNPDNNLNNLQTNQIESKNKN